MYLFLFKKAVGIEKHLFGSNCDVLKELLDKELHRIINPRRACAARVTVLCLFVRLSVCYNTPGFSSGQNAEISTSTKCRRYARVF